MGKNGGKRPGAGRKRGSVAKVDAEVRKAALKEGISPLDYMLKIMRDSGADEHRRDDMAKAAAPYLHAKLQSLQHANAPGTTLAHDHTLKVEFVGGKAG